MTKETQGLHNKIQIGAQQDFQEKKNQMRPQRRKKRGSNQWARCLCDRGGQTGYCAALRNPYTFCNPWRIFGIN